MPDLRHAPPDAPAQPPAGRRSPIRALVADRRVRFLLAGGVTAVVGYSIFTIGWLLAGDWIPYLVLAVIANLANAFVMYPVYRHVVFQYSGPWLAGFIKFYAVFLWGLVLALAGLPLMVEVLHFHVLIALAIIVGLGPVVSYQAHRLWAFRRRS